jgi:hypothetical protein
MASRAKYLAIFQAFVSPDEGKWENEYSKRWNQSEIFILDEWKGSLKSIWKILFFEQLRLVRPRINDDGNNIIKIWLCYVSGCEKIIGVHKNFTLSEKIYTHPRYVSKNWFDGIIY